jgi:hypothetical protein
MSTYQPFATFTMNALNTNTVTTNIINVNESVINDIACENILISNGMTADNAAINNLEISANSNPWVNLTGSQNQVLALGPNNTLEFISVGGESGINSIASGTPSTIQITEPTTGNVVISYIGQPSGIQSVTSENSNITATTTNNNVTLELSNNLTNINNINGFNYPSSIGSNNQVLGVNNNTLEFINLPPATIETITGTTNQITATQTGNNYNLSFPSSVTMNNLTTSTLQNGTLIYPSTGGTNGQVLGMSGGALTFVNETAQGTLTEGANIGIVTSNNNSTISLNPNITVSNLTVGAVAIPPVLGSNNQVLGVNNNTLEFINLPPATVETITGTTNQITATQTGNNYNLSFPSNVTMNNLTSSTLQNGTLIYPSAGGTNGQILGMSGGSLTFVNETAQGEILGSSNINVTTNNNVSTVSLANNITLPNINASFILGATGSTQCNISDNFITLEDGAGDVVNIETNKITITSGPVQGFEANTSGIYANSISLSNSGGAAIYTLPQTLGTASQVLSVPATGNILTWATVGQGGQGIQSIATQTPTQLQIINNNDNVTINYVGEESNGTVTNITSTNSNIIISPSTPSQSVYNLQLNPQLSLTSLTSTGATQTATFSSNGIIISNNISNERSTIEPEEIKSSKITITDVNNNTIATLPTTQPTAGQYLKYDGLQACTWDTPTTQNLTAGTNINITNDIISVSNPLSLEGGGIITTIETNNINCEDSNQNIYYDLSSDTGLTIEQIRLMTPDRTQVQAILTAPTTANTYLNYDGTNLLKWSPVDAVEYTAGPGINLLNNVISVNQNLDTLTNITFGVVSGNNATYDENSIIINSGQEQTAISASSIQLTDDVGGQPKTLLLNTGVISGQHIISPLVSAQNININSAYSLPTNAPTNNGDVILYNGTGTTWGPAINESTDLTINNLTVNDQISTVSLKIGDATEQYIMPLQRPTTTAFLACGPSAGPDPLCYWSTTTPFNSFSYIANSSNWYGAQPAEEILSISTNSQFGGQFTFYYSQTLDLFRFSGNLNLNNVWKLSPIGTQTNKITCTCSLPIDFILLANLNKVYRCDLPTINLSSNVLNTTTAELMGAYLYSSVNNKLEIYFVQSGASTVEATINIYYPSCIFNIQQPGVAFPPNTYNYNIDQACFAIISNCSLFSSLGNVPQEHYISQSF